MRLKSVTLENFRGFVAKTKIEIEADITAFLGGNDAGKSSVMEALNIFFNGGIEPGDASVHGDDKNVSITCEFCDLPTELVIDVSHKTTLKDEYLLNQNGCLEIKKVFDCSLSKPKQSGIYALANHPTGESVGDLLSLKIATLRTRARELQVDLANVNQSISSEIRHAIWSSQSLSLKLCEISLEKDEGKKIYDAIDKYLPLFALFKSDRASTDQDQEAQDPMKVAIKDVTNKMKAQFEEMEAQITVALQHVAEETIKKITEISPTLGGVLTPNVSSKKLETLFNVSLTGENDIPVNKRGSGVRRLILFGFFRAEAERKLAENSKQSVIYAVEEPETSQHPNNQIMILNALRDLANGENEQVLITTHTPVLAARLEERSLRYVKNIGANRLVAMVDSDDVRREITTSLGILPDNKVKAFFAVEGPNDVAFLKIISSNLSKLDAEKYVDFAQAESEGTLVFIPMGGSTLQCWTTNLNGMNRKIFNLLDRDNKPPAPPHYKEAAEAFRAAGHIVFVTKKREIENYIPVSLLKSSIEQYTGTGDDFDDVPTLYSKATKRAFDSGNGHVQRLGASSAKRYLSTTIAQQINTLELFNEGDPDGEMRGWIRQVSDALRE